MRKLNFKKVLFGLSLSLVLAMAIGSFAIGETQTPANPQVQTTSNALTNDATCDFDVSGDASEYAFSYSDEDGGVLTITGGEHTISMEEGVEKTTQRIVITGAATITLNNVNIESAYGAAIQIEDNADFDVSIILANGSVNTLKGKAGDVETDEFGAPGIDKSNDKDVDAKNLGTLTIGSINGPKKAGILNVHGGYYAAGIGSVCALDAVAEEYVAKNANNITITGGEINAKGGALGAGIGGGNVSSTSYIVISGGKVTATGDGAAGIGGGFYGNGSYITIKSGVVVAKGGFGGAGIGGGERGSGSNIKITGGNVTATGGYGGAGIGGGNYGSGSNNSITGDNVVVIAKNGDSSKDALEGFGTIDKGLIFRKGQETSGSWSGTMYNSVEISWDVEFPTSLTVPNGATIKNKANLTFASGANITCVGTGKVETLLKYDPQGGTFSGLDDSYQLYQDSSGTGKSYINLPTPTTNATFNGWNKKADGTGAKLSESTVDLNLHQAYADMDYTVTFDSQGGSDVSPVSPIKYKSKVTKPTDPTREGYTFDTWYKEESCTNKWDFDKDTVQGDTTLYAGWTEKEKYNITINQLENGSVTSDKAQAVENETVTLTVTPAEGYELQENSLKVMAGTTAVTVTKGADGTYTFTMPASEVTISAVFEQIPDPTPTPPGPEPEPTPEPTPDPSVNPDGDGSGSGSSSKTSDPFMGGAALALLGVATTGAILTRKFK